MSTLLLVAITELPAPASRRVAELFSQTPSDTFPAGSWQVTLKLPEVPVRVLLPLPGLKRPVVEFQPFAEESLEVQLTVTVVPAARELPPPIEIVPVLAPIVPLIVAVLVIWLLLLSFPVPVIVAL